VSLRDNPLGELKVPLTWTAGIVFIVVLIASVAILLAEGRKSYDTDANGVARTMSDRMMAPVGDALAAPGRWTGAGIDTVRGYFFAVSENRRLQAELREMRQWREVAIALKDTNERYQQLLGLKTDPPIPMVAARIVTDSRGPFANSRLANAGTEKGVLPGNPVMSENGLVGRITGVTDGVSRVLMLTDVASRTPVMVDRTNARAILTGDGGPNPRLEYLRGQEPVREGDRVLTSGDGGVFPRGLPVGYAVKGLDGRWRVVLAADRAPIDYVRILLFQDFTQVAHREALEKPTPPPPTPGAGTLTPAAPVAPEAAVAAALAAKPSAPATGKPAEAKPTGADAKTPAATAGKPPVVQPKGAPNAGEKPKAASTAGEKPKAAAPKVSEPKPAAKAQIGKPEAVKPAATEKPPAKKPAPKEAPAEARP
jgi:rod shape-determining protein MreC